MERRREKRIEISGPATIKVLTGSPVVDKDSAPVAAEILDISGSGLRMRVPRPIPGGTPVEIDAGDTMALGEICRCEPEQATNPQGPFVAGVQISQVVASVEQMRRFSRRLDEYSSMVEVGERSRS